MWEVITPARMRALEQAYMLESGTPGFALMERAATAVVDTLMSMTGAGALFLCGPGNNGGDGYAAARLYAARGRHAFIWALSDPDRLTGGARMNWQLCVECAIPLTRVTNAFPALPEDIGVVVDALFGTGLERPLEGLYGDAVKWINACGLPVLAVDMPSGIPGLMVRAEKTVTFHRMKPVHLLYPGRTMAGDVTVADIGIPHTASPEDFTVLGAEDISLLLPPRAPDAHKGTVGHALLLAGNHGMAGAAALCAGGALRGGAGLVTIACPGTILPTLQSLQPCAMCVPQDALPDAIAGKDAIAAGPGLGCPEKADELLSLLADTPCPQVWDADALNWLASHPRRLGDRFILTPHPGEAARLLDTSIAAIAADPPTAAEAIHRRYDAIVLLKGATTVIHSEAGRALNVTGTPGMATGGSGDVLTGLIAALLAQGLSPFDAARLGALLHGMAGRSAAEKRGTRSMTAMDLLDALKIN
ncbi:NAD(P)H-hydrate dehydratase [Eubacteriales bacterium OttesenSCG-928-A19]|nr:NAD(P)H-hydrate dehydratase [Eubacteriales bacterium OttesenSCG-928-A19]